MNNKNIKLMLLGIALIIFGATMSLYELNGVIFFENADWLNSLQWIIIEISSFISPIAGLILVIVGFLRKDSDIKVENLEEEISEEENIEQE